MIKFLKREIILRFHDDQIERYGGSPGIRDLGLLDSALAQPEMSFGGEYMHQSIFEMAAAYGYHICKNHPFYDGNKRTALIAILTFLNVNGYAVVADKRELYAIMVDLAAGKVEKPELAKFLEENVAPKGSKE